MLIHLFAATPQNAGAKAATLGQLAKAGFPVPPGFVVPVDTYLSVVDPLDIPTVLSHHGPAEARRLIEAQSLPPGLLTELANALTSLGNLPVAVRSSATTEDTPHASAAGQHTTHLAVHGLTAVATTLLTIWSSLHSPQATSYRQPAPTPPPPAPTAAASTATASTDPAPTHPAPTHPALTAATPTDPAPASPAMAVLVQRHVDADVAGVLFTAGPHDTSDPGGRDVAVIEASWGLGESIVQGLVTPDEYVVGADGVRELRLGDKRTRIDRSPIGTATSEVPEETRRRPCLTDGQVEQLWKLGQKVADYLGGPQDIEFAFEKDQLWLLQARPITAPLVRRPPTRSTEQVLQGIAGSPGIASGPVCIVNGPEDFAKVASGNILVCRFTDPAWTTLFSVIAGVVTETGGRLSHAAIVARERRIPAVLGVPAARTTFSTGDHLTIDGSTGTISLTPR